MDQADTVVEKRIYQIRDERVMLDFDLAELYGVEVRDLTRQVNRNKERFPADFMFELENEDLADLRCQIGTANSPTNWNHMRRSNVRAFTENGVAMLSGVLHSERAIEVNIAIMRTFTRLRSNLVLDESGVTQLRDDTMMFFRMVFKRLDKLEGGGEPHPPDRKMIGIKE